MTGGCVTSSAASAVIGEERVASMLAMVTGCWISQSHSVAGPSTTTEGCALHLPVPHETTRYRTNSKSTQGGFVSGRQCTEVKRNDDDEGGLQLRGRIEG